MEKEKIKFAPTAGSGLREALMKRVNQYFTEQEISKKGDWRLYSKTIILFTLLLISFATAPLATEPWVVYIHYAIRGLIVAGIGFCVMHDASHGCYSENKTLEKWALFLGGDVMGLSTFIWDIKHVQLHHTFTNIEGYDDDIAQSALLRMNTQQPKRPWHKYQHIYAIFLYMLLSIFWIVNDFKRVYRDKRVMNKEFAMKPKEIRMFLLGKALSFLLFLVIPLFVMPVWWHALVGFLIMHVVLGLTLSLVFQGAHVVEETAFPEPPTMEEWMLHQITTTADFDPKNKWLSWFVGGLNFQIEHHLFPNVSHVHYPKLAEIVQSVCREFGIHYIVFPTSRAMLKSHFGLLKKVGNAA